MADIDIMVCGICRKIKRANIVILGRNICKSCEEEIVGAKAGDEAYSRYMESIRNIFDNSGK
ncbi:MAG TPA: sigma factor G inhibitor Gin [Candidatus Atribacteria bacterium]|nr:sigma factor G inhibitor Gin [Candidatus Atribacteria bacterium]HPT79180.1 sigma factor G inhibitor Gin [Candidatus Atribacteria bacterium]